MKKTIFLAIASSIALPATGISAEKQEATDCSSIRATTTLQIKEQPSSLLEIVRSQISANADCACDIVKTAIATSDASAKEVAAIVETAITSAPEHSRLIAQCAVAVAPDALKEIQGVLAKFDKNAGESAPSGKYSPKDVDKGGIAPRQASSPLDFPQGPNGGGTPEITLPPYFMPPVAPPTIGVTPPNVTVTNPAQGGGGSTGGSTGGSDVLDQR